MTIRHIRIFLAVCENGNNLTRAAKALYMAQPAVSLAISELEEHYGTRLFERLYRRDPSRGSGGAGLGLTIAREIVRLHGGTVSARCADGRTVFTVTLPVGEAKGG